MKHEIPSPSQIVTTELLLLPDGQILAHNLSPALAAILAELNPADTDMQQRAEQQRKSSPKLCAP